MLPFPELIFNILNRTGKVAKKNNGVEHDIMRELLAVHQQIEKSAYNAIQI